MKYKLVILVKFIVFCLLFFLLARAGISREIYPFAFSMLFALAWANQKVWLLVPSYIIGYLASFHTLYDIIICLTTVAVLTIPYYIHVLAKKPIKKIEMFALALVSQTSYIVLNILNASNPIYIALSVVLGIVFLYLAIVILEALIVRGFSSKLTLFEIICGAIVLMAISAGLTNSDLFGFSFLKLFVSLMILTLSYSAKAIYPLSFACIMGIGSLLPNSNAVMIAPFVIWALFVIIFKMQNRLYSALALILAEALIGFYFNLYYSYDYLQALPLLISAVAFLAFPKSLFKSLAIMLSVSSDRLAIKSVINRNREVLKRRLDNLSEVFYDMNGVFRKLIKSQMSDDEVKNMLYEEIKNSICKNCPERNHCHRTFSEDTKKVFKELVTIALERGKINLLDLPSYLSSRCNKSSYLISEVNTLTSQYKSYSKLVGNVDTSKLLISDQLYGISALMKTLSNEVDALVSFDSARETRLIDELTANNIICQDVVVYEKDAKTTLVCAVVREEDVSKLKLQNIVSKICNHKMTIYEVYPTAKAGLVNVNLKTAPIYDCVFGLASQAKTGGAISGDSHSIIRLDGEKFMFAICDGMGSGEKAGEKSQTAIGLIESFYKAGFDNETILSSVNKLLNLENEDIFSTMDICIVDLKSGIADFVKMGANASYVRGKEGCNIVEGGALPIGVLDQAKSLTRKIVLNEKDFIVICSDGINDSFASDGEFKDFILTIKTANPQEFADTILERALANSNGYAVDDMTVLVVKII